MKKYRSALSLLLAALLLIGSLAACTPKEPSSSQDGSHSESSPSDPGSDVSEEAPSADSSADTPSDTVTEPDGSSSASSGSLGTTAGTKRTDGSSAVSKPTKATLTTTTVPKITYPTLPSGFVYKTESRDDKADMKFPAASKESFTQAAAKTPSASKPSGSIYNAKDFGVTPNDMAADSAALQHAMDTVYKLGGTLYIPAGLYIIDKPLTIPQRMTVVGDYTGISDTDCTTFLVYCGHGKGNDTALITMSGYSTFTGVRIYYPKQSKSSPVAYPPTFANKGDSFSIEEVFVVNPWIAMNFVSGSGRHWLKNISGQPLSRGLVIDHCLDVGRTEGITFAPYWSRYVTAYTLKNLTAFTWGKTDWEFVNDCRAEYAAVGFSCTTLPTNGNPGNVLFSGISAYRCREAVSIDAVQGHAGAVFSKSVFDGAVNIRYTTDGPVKFTGCTFTANSYNATPLNLQGVGPVIIRGCTVDTAGAGSASTPAMIANADRMIVTGNHFIGKATTDIRIGSEVKSGVFTGNLATGHALSIKDESNGGAVH